MRPKASFSSPSERGVETVIKVCISGVPGTGKTTICDILSDRGYSCKHLDVVAASAGCLHGDEVDIERLNSQRIEAFAVEGHYAHLLDCRLVIILECGEIDLRKRLLSRGYPKSKIDENVDVQLSGILYFEALDRLPAGRILRIDTCSMGADEVVERIIQFVGRTDSINL